MKCLLTTIKFLLIIGIFINTPLLTYAKTPSKKHHCEHAKKHDCKHDCKHKCKHHTKCCKGDKGDRGKKGHDKKGDRGKRGHRGHTGRPGTNCNCTAIDAFGQWFITNPANSSAELLVIDEGDPVPYDCNSAVVPPVNLECAPGSTITFYTAGVYSLTYTNVAASAVDATTVDAGAGFGIFIKPVSSIVFSPVSSSFQTQNQLPMTAYVTVNEGDQLQIQSLQDGTTISTDTLPAVPAYLKIKRIAAAP